MAIEKTKSNIIYLESEKMIDIDTSVINIIPPIKQYEGSNNNSIIARLSYKDFDFLFTGDIEKEAEYDIINRNQNIESEVLKVSHHGSNSSSTNQFLNKVKPKYSVISVGKENKYSHPSNKVINRLKENGSEIYRTDINGNIVFKLKDTQEIDIDLERS